MPSTDLTLQRILDVFESNRLGIRKTRKDFAL